MGRQRDLEQMKVFLISFITACYGQSNTFQQANAVAHAIVNSIQLFDDFNATVFETRDLALSIWNNNLTNDAGNFLPLSELKGSWDEIGLLIFDNNQLFDTATTGLKDAVSDLKNIVDDLCLPFNDFKAGQGSIFVALILTFGWTG